MDKKEWLDKLYYVIGRQQYDFALCGLKLKDGEVKSTKWKTYRNVCFPLNPEENYKLNWINQRQILPCEVVLDLETKETLPKITSKLTELGYIFYVFQTGSRGYHVHVFFNRDLTEEEKLQIIKYFGADTQKSSKRTMIALEFSEHYKSGKIKDLIEDGNNKK